MYAICNLTEFYITTTYIMILQNKYIYVIIITSFISYIADMIFLMYFKISLPQEISSSRTLVLISVIVYLFFFNFKLSYGILILIHRSRSNSIIYYIY